MTSTGVNRGFSLLGLLFALGFGIITFTVLARFSILQKQQIAHLSRKTDLNIIRRQIKNSIDCPVTLALSVGATCKTKQMARQYVKVYGFMGKVLVDQFTADEVTQPTFGKMGWRAFCSGSDPVTIEIEYQVVPHGRWESLSGAMPIHCEWAIGQKEYFVDKFGQL
jgi:hypothetical protein